MLARRNDPFPFEAARDLLGITRIVARAKRDAGRDRQAAALTRIARRLADALELSQSAPGSVGHRAAFTKIESAARELGDHVAIVDGALAWYEAGIRRVQAARR